MADLYFLLIFLIPAYLSAAVPERYVGLQVVRVLPRSATQVEKLMDLMEETQLDFWTEPTDVGIPVDIMTSQEFRPNLIHALRNMNIGYQVHIDDVQRLIDEESRDNQLIGEPGTFDLNKYNRVDDILAWLDSIAASCEICSLDSIGKSYEKRDLKIIKIGIPGKNKKSIFMEGTIHAREWIAPATVLHMINKFITTYETDSVVKQILERFDLYILPVLNPDGYEYSHTVNRLWRKTRRPNVGSTCVGTDGNRNFAYEWGGVGASANPCSNTYRGPRAFSEPETKQMADYIMARSDSMVSYLAFHSQGQWWLTPWGYTSNLPNDYDDMVAVGKKAADALRTYRGTNYRVGSAARLLYPSSGGSDDWTYGTAKIKFSYVLELPGHGYGHVLPPRYIPPVAEETWLAVRATGQALLDYYK